MFLLTLTFLATAALYASVGFGGGSTYNALLVLHGVDHRVLPAVALVCNVIVVAGTVVHALGGLAPILRRLAPFLATSIAAAWIGGRIPVSEAFFIGALGLTLLAAGLGLLVDPRPDMENRPMTARPMAGLAIGAALGFVSGLVGIGGGVFLAPILHFLRWGPARDTAIACSLFILLNSLSGLTGQLVKLGDLSALSGFTSHWPLFVAVLIGGQTGALFSKTRLSGTAVKRLTAVLVLYVSARLLYQWTTTAI